MEQGGRCKLNGRDLDRPVDGMLQSEKRLGNNEGHERGAMQGVINGNTMIMSGIDSFRLTL